MIALLVRGEQLWDNLQVNEDWQNFLATFIKCLASVSSNDDNVLIPPPLPSLVRAAAPPQPSIHLGRCRSIDSTLVKLAEELLQSLECVPLKAQDSRLLKYNSNDVINNCVKPKAQSQSRSLLSK